MEDEGEGEDQTYYLEVFPWSVACEFKCEDEMNGEGSPSLTVYGYYWHREGRGSVDGSGPWRLRRTFLWRSDFGTLPLQLGIFDGDHLRFLGSPLSYSTAKSLHPHHNRLKRRRRRHEASQSIREATLMISVICSILKI
ncbi:Spc97 / Spc98 family of spindle pole body (SBP)component [Striga asiatica]|uniref:Spc97 / Spc98 family of spindle pole body (SBP)component n=1 Tax=Striga asiatica TaxID=4170 RepID=A0A5A7Q8W4_STRAF|nr:Spc97 / Spc98 family of spindle pole body (SBP)component [Striga asiatica]